MNWRVGIDTGGTFTDVVAVNTRSGDLELHKVHSTPEEPSNAVINGVLEIVRRGGFSLEDIALIVHGSTVATNAVLTRSGARLAMVTTRGFRDVLQIRRQNRPELYDLRSRRPEGLVVRSHIIEVDERVLYDGTVLKALSHAEIGRAASRIAELDVDAVIVGMLNSYVNPDHERLLGDRLRRDSLL